MAAKPSHRSRATNPSPDLLTSEDNNNAVPATLSEKLKIFKSTNFDADAYVTSKCQNMSEKEMRQLCSYLLDLKKASAEELRISVYSNYAAFIKTSKEISDLEGELISIRNLMSTQAALVHGLAEGVRVESLSTGDESSTKQDESDFERSEPSEIEKWYEEFPDVLEVLLSERKFDEALSALDDGESRAEEADVNKTLSTAAILSLRVTITENRQKLADQLAETACQPSTRGVELRSAILALKNLGDGPRAHSLLLNAHSRRLQSSMQGLRPSSISYGGAFTSTLSQLVFSTIAQAADDSLAVFGEEPAYASELVTWSIKQTESFAFLVKRHALSSSAAAGGLRAAAECVQIALGHCSLLENRGLALSPVLLRLFRPCVEQALDANLKKIDESSAALATADDWVLTYPPVGTRPSGKSAPASLGSVIVNQPKLSNSAHRFNTMVQEFFEDVGPLLSMQLGSTMLNGLLQVFTSYVNLLISALPGSVEDEGNLGVLGNRIVRMAETDAQQLALFANASLLAEELLPRAAMKLGSLNHAGRKDDAPRRASDKQNRLPEQREWKRKLQRAADRLKDSLCRHHALDLIFTEDGDPRLSAEMYIRMDGNVEEPEWFPSPIFQELFVKVSGMAAIVADMFVGRERVATLLLMRLTETVIMWLSNDQAFWEELEEGQTTLGPYGLQQFYLDMEFVILFSNESRCLSRNLHQVIKNIIARAIDVVQASGLDPYSALPEDEWFAEVSQIAIKMLSNRNEFGSMDRDATSPTSVVSHGSS